MEKTKKARKTKGTLQKKNLFKSYFIYIFVIFYNHDTCVCVCRYDFCPKFNLEPLQKWLVAIYARDYVT